MSVLSALLRASPGFDAVGVLFAFASGLTFAIYAAIRSRGTEKHDGIGPSMSLMAVLAMGMHLPLERRQGLVGRSS